MRRSLRRVGLWVCVTLAFAGCGGGDGTPATTTVPTTVAPSTTTTERPDIVCLGIATKALALFNAYRRDVRGIAGADEARYARDAEAIRAESRAAGCPNTPLRGFPPT